MGGNLGESMKTDMEKKNDERLKAVIRDWLQDKIDSVTATMEQMLASQRHMPNSLVDGLIDDLDSKLSTLRWLHAMTRPSNPNTINQYSQGAPDANS